MDLSSQNSTLPKFEDAIVLAKNRTSCGPGRTTSKSEEATVSPSQPTQQRGSSLFICRSATLHWALSTNVLVACPLEALHKNEEN
ncbi:hypothetical protein RB195_018985 [Necator americanus]|uniref:Uncharacterized protein n=1 Tax=Necator americanus TaxID=51031 RepID=A0ABR1CE45_NECAM